MKLLNKLGLFIVLVAVVSLVACDDGSATPTKAVPTPAPGQAMGGTGALKKVRIGMGYIPNVQFAAYYVAQEKGYYKKAGLEVSFDYGNAPDLLAQVATGKLDFANSEGDEVITAAAQGVKDVYVLAQYSRFPVAIFSLASKNIKTPADLIGKKIGVPGKYGATYNGLKATLYANKIDESKVTIVEIGYTQAQAVQTGQVDAAVGYAMNEPVLLTQQGQQLNLIQVADQYNLASVGVIASQQLVASDPTTVQKFVGATLLGLRDMNANPDEAYTIAAKKDYAAIDPANAATQQAVLRETVKFQQPVSGQQLGASDPAVWQATTKFLSDTGLVKAAPDVSTLFTNQFIPQPSQ